MSAGAARPPRDAGLQAERTALAWNRTGMALLANALLALRLGLVGGQALVMGLGVALLGGALAVTLLGRRRRRALVGAVQVAAPPPWMMQFTALAAVAAGLTGLAGVLALLLQ